MVAKVEHQARRREGVFQAWTARTAVKGWVKAPHGGCELVGPAEKGCQGIAGRPSRVALGGTALGFAQGVVRRPFQALRGARPVMEVGRGGTSPAAAVTEGQDGGARRWD